MPRTASRFMRKFLLKELGDNITMIDHEYHWHENGQIKTNHFEQDDCWRFCFVRNPYPRFFSAYKHIVGQSYQGLNPPDRKEREAILKFNGLKDFCLNLGDFTSDFSHNPVHFIPQKKWISNSEGRLLMDYIAKYEFMNDSWREISDKLSISYTPIFNRDRKFGLKKRFTDSYKTMFDFLFPEYHPSFLNNEILPLIQDFYKEDFEQFEYSQDFTSFSNTYFMPYLRKTSGYFSTKDKDAYLPFLKTYSRFK
jgi:hypothetical protein